MLDTRSIRLLKGEISTGKPMWGRLFIDLFLYVLSFYTAYALKKKALILDKQYLALFFIYLLVWILVHLLYSKFTRLDEERRRSHKMTPFLTCFLYMGGIISVYLYVADLFELSRFIIYGSLSLYFMLEMIFLSGGYLPFFYEGVKRRKRILSFSFFSVELIALAGIYAWIYLSDYGLEGGETPSAVPFFYINFIWVLSGLMVHHYRLVREQNYLKTIYPHIKNFIVVICFSAAIMYIFKLTGSSPGRYLLPMAVVAALELFFVSIYYLSGNWDEEEGNYLRPGEIMEAKKVGEVLAQEQATAPEPIRFEKNRFSSKHLIEKLRNHYLKKMPEILSFVESTVDLKTVDIQKAEVINSSNPYNVDVIPDGSMEFFMNLQLLNKQRYFNRYLIEVNKKLVNGGAFIGKFAPCEFRRIHFVKRYPRVMANILYFFDFVWSRVFPKVVFLKKIFFFITKGRRRVMSLAEGFGRLYYCGFEFVGLEFHEQYVFFTARKVKEPSLDASPSYGPLFKMRRTGKNGKPIYVYKMRTMHPYSEYLQGYITELFGYGDKGKVKNDFRVTAWGRFLRRLWLDEAPQLINLLKGDLGLVGVRPLSDRFLQNYPEWLREERKKYKPGCFPPYVAYRTQQVDQYMDSEIRYLNEKKKHPFWTDVKILFVGIFNIVTNRIRSE